MILEARSLSRRWITVTVAREPGQEGGLLDRGVPTADHRDVLLAEEEPVAGGAPGHTVTRKPFSPGMPSSRYLEPVATITDVAR